MRFEIVEDSTQQPSIRADLQVTFNGGFLDLRLNGVTVARVNQEGQLFVTHIPEEYRERLPGIDINEEGFIQVGNPDRHIFPAPDVDAALEEFRTGPPEEFEYNEAES